MNINFTITKGEFQLLMDMLSLSNIGILNCKKLPKSYNYKKFIKLVNKILNQAKEQNVELKYENTPTIDAEEQEIINFLNDLHNELTN